MKKIKAWLIVNLGETWALDVVTREYIEPTWALDFEKMTMINPAENITDEVDEETKQEATRLPPRLELEQLYWIHRAFPKLKIFYSYGVVIEKDDLREFKKKYAKEGKSSDLDDHDRPRLAIFMTNQLPRQVVDDIQVSQRCAEYNTSGGFKFPEGSSPGSVITAGSDPQSVFNPNTLIMLQGSATHLAKAMKKKGLNIENKLLKKPSRMRQMPFWW